MNYHESDMHDLEPKQCIIRCPVRIIYLLTSIHVTFLETVSINSVVKEPLLCDIELTGLMNEIIDIRHSLKKTVEVAIA